MKRRKLKLEIGCKVRLRTGETGYVTDVRYDYSKRVPLVTQVKVFVRGEPEVFSGSATMLARSVWIPAGKLKVLAPPEEDAC